MLGQRGCTTTNSRGLDPAQPCGEPRITEMCLAAKLVKMGGGCLGDLSPRLKTVVSTSKSTLSNK